MAFCCVRAYATGGFLCTHVRSERPKTHHIGGIKSGSCPPAIESKVGLHKGFDAHKAPDTPPGRIDDVVGGFQITSLYSVTEESTSCRSPCMDFLPPSGGVFWLSFSGSSPCIPCRRSCDCQGTVLDLAIKNRHTTT